LPVSLRVAAKAGPESVTHVLPSCCDCIFAAGRSSGPSAWLLFLSGHTMRHTSQIREVKADAGVSGEQPEAA
jgi:hypothetical protein